MRLKRFVLPFACCLLIGCGGGGPGTGASGSPGAVASAPEVNYAQAIRGSIRQVEDGLKEGGLPVAKGNTESLLEALEGYESNSAAAPHKATYDQIVNTAKELKGMFDSSASKADIEKKINELTALADKLPSGAPPG